MSADIVCSHCRCYPCFPLCPLKVKIDVPSAPAQCSVCVKPLPSEGAIVVLETEIPGLEHGNPNHLVGWHQECAPQFALDIYARDGQC